MSAASDRHQPPLDPVVPAPADAGADVGRVIDTLRGRGIRMVRISHPDLHGKCRSKDLPLDELELATDGLGYCLVSLFEDMNGNPLDLPGFAGDSPFPDFKAVADLSTARIIPWEPDTAWFLADLQDDRGVSARGALERVCSRLAHAGLTAITAPELEFYLLRSTSGGPAQRHGSGEGFAYTAGRRADPGGAFGRMHRALHQLGIGITTAHHEYSPGQFEINLRHGPAREASDRAFLFKEALRELAVGEGLRANFMPKPFEDAEGSGLHVHISLVRDGDNAFAAGVTDSRQVNRLCGQFVAGLLEHAAALTAIAAPTVNSYARLVPGGMVPTVADWGYDNRFTYVRIPPERGRGTRIELRFGDAAANPYLLTAAALAAGLDGIERELTPPAPRADSDVGSDGPALPSTLGLALDALERDATVVDALGAELVRTFVALKRDEVERQRRAVTDWDWKEYALHA